MKFEIIQSKFLTYLDPSVPAEIIIKYLFLFSNVPVSPAPANKRLQVSDVFNAFALRLPLSFQPRGAGVRLVYGRDNEAPSRKQTANREN